MKKKVKCVVWDLDNTIWDGVLTENADVHIKKNVKKVIDELDHRGILQSISSKNDEKLALSKLDEFGLKEMFLFPEISWGAKSKGIQHICDQLNIRLDSIAFIDDQQFERDEVHFYCPEVLCIDAADVDSILDNEMFIPIHITDDSKNRRQLYLNDIKRNEAKKDFDGTEVEFLKQLKMIFTVRKVQNQDLERVEELTIRTHQLNSTGITFSYDELKTLSESSNYIMLIAQLQDRYGDYGKIGLALLETTDKAWIIKLLLMSCRVMSRGVGAVLINYISLLAKEYRVSLYADFVHTDANRVMYITYKFNGFQKIGVSEGIEHLAQDVSYAAKIPDYITFKGDFQNNFL